MSVWSQDAVWQVRDDLAFTGSDEIRSAIQQQWATCRRAFHWTSNPSILVSPDTRTARARFDVRSEVELLDGTWVSLTGSYHDEYRREPAGWRMTTRIAVVHTQRPL